MIKSEEYERLSEEAKNKLINKEKMDIKDNILNPIVINTFNISLHIGQIKTYMNFIDSNLKSIYQDNTIGIIICKKDNKYIIEYCSDHRVIRTTYQLN